MPPQKQVDNSIENLTRILMEPGSKAVRIRLVVMHVSASEQIQINID